MSRAVRKKLDRRLAAALLEAGTADFRSRVFSLRRPKVDAFRRAHPEAEVRLRQVKGQALAGLAELVAQAADRMKGNGFAVFFAGSPEEALDYIDGIAVKGPVVKTKSNAAKEINLSRHLEKRGIEVVETDLGDRICQLGKVDPAHPLGPAAHLPVARVAEILSNHAGERLSPDPPELVRWARESLRDTLLKADLAITGANAIAADTGSVVLTENEGNIRMAVSVPPVLVVVAGIEKIVPTLEDCLDVVKCTAGFGVGQEIGTYVSVISGPAGKDSLFRPRGPVEVHVVLLEKGRREVVGTPLEETLKCINCGHCLRVCPVFCELGELYGKPFYGGIGVLKVAAKGDPDGAYLSGLDLCLGCRRCTSACPAGIQTPDLIALVRRQRVRKHGLAAIKKHLVRNLINLSPMKRKVFYRIQGLIGVRHGLYRKTRVKVAGRNIVPDLAARPLTGMLGKYEREACSGETVIYFPGCMHNLFFVRTGVAAVELLKKTGARAVLPPDQACCGYPALAAGDIGAARAAAARNLAFFMDMGCSPVLVDCPTCRTGLSRYHEIFESDAGGWLKASRVLAGRVRSLSAFLADRLHQLGPLSLPGTSATYHRPCHLDDEGAAADEHILRNITGLAYSPVKEAGCCGFGGAFSLDFYSLSGAIRRRRLGELLSCGPQLTVTSCPGCAYHLSEGLYRQGSRDQVLHISDLLIMSVNNTGGEKRWASKT